MAEYYVLRSLANENLREFNEHLVCRTIVVKFNRTCVLNGFWSENDRMSHGNNIKSNMKTVAFCSCE